MRSRKTKSGSEALTMLKSKKKIDRVDLVLLDFQMPEMDGLVLTQEIRKKKNANELPIMMLTSATTPVFKEKIRNLGLLAVLVKPIKPSELYNEIIAHYSSRPKASETPIKKQMFDSQLADEHPLKILVTEDNIVNQTLTVLILERLGYQADLVGNGKEALEAVKKKRYDLVLMDIQMPEMDGLTATKCIRQDLQKENQPRIVAMTAAAMKEDRDKCIEAGMDDYIIKPVSIEDLTRILSSPHVTMNEEIDG